jgi:hypothetical protein
MDTKLDCEVSVDMHVEGPADMMVCREGRDGC